jgi:hypothetical protein
VLCSQESFDQRLVDENLGGRCIHPSNLEEVGAGR